MKELLDKEVILIDGQEHVKVLNPQASEGGGQPKYLYLPVNEYLAKREWYADPLSTMAASQRINPAVSAKPSAPPAGKEVYLVSPAFPVASELKRKVMVAHFDDRTTTRDETMGDWVAEKLIREIGRRSSRILTVDFQMVREFLEKKELELSDLETSKVLHMLNEVFGIHALVVGQLTGPYIFTKGQENDPQRTASAILKVELRVVDTLSGKTVKTLSANNPVIATKEKGTFSEEKAKGRAIDLTLAELSRPLVREIEGLAWFCRIAKVEGEEVYVNAGKLTGLKVGDLMEVFRPGKEGEQEEVKGRIQISACFGIDASMGKLVNGNRPEVDDILRLAKRE